MPLFLSWEGRPAVILDGKKGFAIVSPGGEWEPVEIWALDNGRVMSAADFALLFPVLPAIPNGADTLGRSNYDPATDPDDRATQISLQMPARAVSPDGKLDWAAVDRAFKPASPPFTESDELRARVNELQRENENLKHNWQQATGIVAVLLAVVAYLWIYAGSLSSAVELTLTAAAILGVGTILTIAIKYLRHKRACRKWDRIAPDGRVGRFGQASLNDPRRYRWWRW
jgi:hypothetical protein